MTTTYSTVPAVKAALVSLLTSALGGAVQVTYGRPPDKGLKRETVWIGSAKGVHEFASIRAGRRDRNEEYTIEVVAAVLKARGSAQDADNRLYAILHAVEDVLANDVTLGGVPGLQWAQVAGWEEDAGLSAEGSIAAIRVEIDCTARLI